MYITSDNAQWYLNVKANELGDILNYNDIIFLIKKADNRHQEFYGKPFIKNDPFVFRFEKALVKIKPHCPRFWYEYKSIIESLDIVYEYYRQCFKAG